MTEREQKVLELAIKLREAKFSVEEALIRQQYLRAVDLLIKERRGAKVENASNNDMSPPSG